MLVVYVVALGVGGKHLHNISPPAEAATAQAILSFAGTIAGFVITYCPLASDFTIYYKPSVPRCALPRPSFLGIPLTAVVQLEDLLVLLPRL